MKKNEEAGTEGKICLRVGEKKYPVILAVMS